MLTGSATSTRVPLGVSRKTTLHGSSSPASGAATIARCASEGLHAPKIRYPGMATSSLVRSVSWTSISVSTPKPSELRSSRTRCSAIARSTGRSIAMLMSRFFTITRSPSRCCAQSIGERRLMCAPCEALYPLLYKGNIAPQPERLTEVRPPQPRRIGSTHPRGTVPNPDQLPVPLEGEAAAQQRVVGLLTAVLTDCCPLPRAVDAYFNKVRASAQPVKRHTRLLGETVGERGGQAPLEEWKTVPASDRCSGQRRGAAVRVPGHPTRLEDKQSVGSSKMLLDQALQLCRRTRCEGAIRKVLEAGPEPEDSGG